MKRECYYAVVEGTKLGIFTEYYDCLSQVSGYSNAKFKKFTDFEDAQWFVFMKSYYGLWIEMYEINRTNRLYKNSHKLLSNSLENNLQHIKVLTDNQDSMTKEEIGKHITILNEDAEKRIKYSNHNNPVINSNKTMKLNYCESELEEIPVFLRRARLKPNKKGKNRVRFNNSKKRSLESD